MILAGLRNYIADHPKDWHLYTDTLTYAYNTQVNSINNCTPFELVLSRPPPLLAIAVFPNGEAADFPKEYHLKWSK